MKRRKFLGCSVGLAVGGSLFNLDPAPARPWVDNDFYVALTMGVTPEIKSMINRSIERNMLVYDSDAKNGQISNRHVSLMWEIYNRNIAENNLDIVDYIQGDLHATNEFTLYVDHNTYLHPSIFANVPYNTPDFCKVWYVKGFDNYMKELESKKQICNVNKRHGAAVDREKYCLFVGTGPIIGGY